MNFINSWNIDLRMNMKIKVMCTAWLEVMVWDEKLIIVEDLIHLGQAISAHPAHEKEIRKRLVMRCSASAKQLCSELFTLHDGRVYIQCTLLVISYCSEALGFTEYLQRKLFKKRTKKNRKESAECNMEG